MTMTKKTENGVLVRGFKDRRLVVNLPGSLEPMAVNVPLADIRQVAVLGVDPTEEKPKFTVGAQIGVDRWVRLGVFESATEAEAVIQEVAKAIAGSRWTNVWIMLGASLVSGFVFVALGAYFVNSQQPAGANSRVATVAPAPAPAANVAMAPPSYQTPESAPQAYAPPAAPAPAESAVGIQMTPDNEAAMHEYFGAAKK